MANPMVQNFLIEWSKGNHGAMTFLIGLMEGRLTLRKLSIVSAKLENLKTIRGTNLYVLWSDLCDKDYEKVYQLCNHCPDEVLEDACNRQDYSGKQLVEQYFIPDAEENQNENTNSL